MDPIAASIVALLVVALAAVSWRAMRFDALRRDDEHALLLALADRLKAQHVVEVAQADAIRQDAEVEQQRQDVLSMLRSEEAQHDINQGWAGDDLIVRELMRNNDFDPDNDDDIARWNARVQN